VSSGSSDDTPPPHGAPALHAHPPGDPRLASSSLLAPAGYPPAARASGHPPSHADTSAHAHAHAHVAHAAAATAAAAGGGGTSAALLAGELPPAGYPPALHRMATEEAAAEEARRSKVGSPKPKPKRKPQA